MTGLDATFDVAHPSTGQVGKMRRHCAELATDPHHLTGAVQAIADSEAVYRAALKLDDPVALASIGIVAGQVIDQIQPLIATLLAELAQVREHHRQAVHAMQEQERRADEGDDLIRRAIWAFGGNDDAKLERFVIDGISHIHDPARASERARGEARASALEAAAYAAAKKAERLAAVTS